MKKIICLFIAVLMIIPLIASCTNNGSSGDTKKTDAVTETKPNNTTEKPSDSDSTTVSDTKPAVTTEEKIVADLPDTTYDNYTFLIANTAYNETKYNYNFLVSSTPSGDIIDNATYKRTLIIEEKFKITMSEEYKSPTELQTILHGGEDTYAMATVTLSNIMTFVNYGYCLDLFNVDTIDLDKPWWDQNAKEKLAFCNKLFYTFSDATIFGLDNTRATYFNKDVYSTLSDAKENIYSLVSNGTWTIQKMFEYGVQVVTDNGDQIWDAQDSYGVVNNATTFYEAMLTGCDAELMKVADGNPYFYCFDEKAKFIDVYNKLLDTFTSEHVYYTTDTTTGRDMFYSGKTLFTVDTLLMASNARSQNLKFGILPVPKYNESQSEYLNVSPNGHATMLCSTNKDTDRAGVIIEAMSYFSSRYYDAEYALIPQYFELALKYKSSTDEESAESLQIIHDSISYVIKIVGTTFSGSVYSKFAANDRTISSYFDKCATTYKTQLGNLLDKYK